MAGAAKTPCKFEVIARSAGWTRRDLKSPGLVPHYFYHAESDILDTESADWEELCRSQPRLLAMLSRANDNTPLRVDRSLVTEVHTNMARVV